MARDGDRGKFRLLSGLSPGVFEADAAVEDGLLSGEVIFVIGDEVTGALELAKATGFHRRQCGLDFGLEDAERVGIERAEEAFFLVVGVFDEE